MTDKMQLCGTIHRPLIALHISSDIFAHHPNSPNCIFTASGNTYVRHCLLVSWENLNSEFRFCKNTVWRLLMMMMMIENIARNM